MPIKRGKDSRRKKVHNGKATSSHCGGIAMPRKPAINLSINQLWQMAGRIDYWFFDDKGRFVLDVPAKYKFASMNSVKRWRLIGLLALHEAQEAIEELKFWQECMAKSNTEVNGDRVAHMEAQMAKALVRFHRHNDLLKKLQSIIMEGK